jgi:hypothetical protein
MEITNLNPKINDTVMGCTDTEYVGSGNEIYFSRIYDLFIGCTKLGIDPKIIWNELPHNVKVEMNYGKWKYQK